MQGTQVPATQCGNTVTIIYTRSSHFRNFSEPLEKVIHQKLLRKKQTKKSKYFQNKSESLDKRTHPSRHQAHSPVFTTLLLSRLSRKHTFHSVH
jgi:hypothetical protein